MVNLIDKLISYGRFHLGLDEENVHFVRNLLIQHLRYASYVPTECECGCLKSWEVPDKLTSELEQYVSENNLVPKEEVSVFADFIFGLITPLPNEVNARFRELKKTRSSDATDYLYDLSIKNNYIKKSYVDKNIRWTAYFPNNKIDVTINLSKPEKDNKDIAKAVKMTDSGYPLCVLCHENEGYYGLTRLENRTGLRSVNLTLNKEKWFMHYSPFVYYDRHCIVVDETHRPMRIEHRSVNALLDFVKEFPHFFIGSNSDLPIVGGSILNHEHFQGGAYLLPIMYSSPKDVFRSSSYEGISISTLDWFNSVILLEGKKQKDLVSLAMDIVDAWRAYSNVPLEILAEDENGNKHNTVTVLARQVDKVFRIYMILRNNRCNDAHPGGIFHAHEEYHHIKKEGIGLIEAGGMFILPARLIRQIDKIKQVLASAMTVEEAVGYDEETKMFSRMIRHVYHSKDRNLDGAIRDYINKVCRDILENTAVFGKTEEAQKAFLDFISSFTAQ